MAVFTQDLGLRLTREGSLFLDDDGQPSTYAPGHGDLPDALRRSGLLSAFVARGGKYVWIANLDNLGATIDPALLGRFIETGADVMVEVAPEGRRRQGRHPRLGRRRRTRTDARRGASRCSRSSACRRGSTRLPCASSTRTRSSCGPRRSSAPTFAGTGSRSRRRSASGPAVQFERLLQELTAAMPAAYVRVPRDGVAARFLPVKDHDELARTAGRHPRRGRGPRYARAVNRKVVPLRPSVPRDDEVRPRAIPRVISHPPGLDREAARRGVQAARSSSFSSTRRA